MPSRRLPFWLFKALRPGGQRLPDLSWITPWLCISGALKSRHYEELARLGIGSVVDLRCEGRDDEELLASHGIRFLHLPTRDRWAPTQAQLSQGTGWVLDQEAEGRNVLIHCKNGIGRSMVLACCVLMHRGFDLSGAMRLVKSRRWGAHVNRRHREALEQFSAGRSTASGPA